MKPAEIREMTLAELEERIDAERSGIVSIGLR